MAEPHDDEDAESKLRSLTRTFIQYVLMTVGLTLVIWGSSDDNDVRQTVIVNVGTALLVAGTITETWTRLLKKQEERALRKILREELDRNGPQDGLVTAEVAELSVPPDEILRTARTISMTFLYEPLWNATGELETWLHGDTRRRLFIFMPDPDNEPLMEMLAARHDFEPHDVSEFVGMLTHARSTARRYVRGGQAELRFVLAPGPSYSGYVFDPDYHASVRDPRDEAGNPANRRAVQRVYRHHMAPTKKLPTLTIGQGRWWDLMQDDVDYLYDHLDPELAGS